MPSNLPYKISSYGDHAVIIEFGNTIDERINQKVISVFHRLQDEKIIGIKDIIPAYCSVTVVYDVAVIRKSHHNISASNFIQQYIRSVLQYADFDQQIPSRQMEIPVCYDAEFALDIQHIASQKKISAEEIIRKHSSKIYRVYMIGFIPGFAYMASVDSQIATPRKQQPRQIVPAGSIGIAGFQTGIYPLQTPGGWNIIGQTPLKLFDAANEQPCLLQPGDEVRFVPVTKKEFDKIKSTQ
jgi:inhibitor of KinA